MSFDQDLLRFNQRNPDDPSSRIVNGVENKKALRSQASLTGLAEARA
jgi:hypothetical protein